jgi:hypothetical protein
MGFYQFSPELYYRALSNQNGFEIKHMIAVESFTRGRWFDVCRSGSSSSTRRNCTRKVPGELLYSLNESVKPKSSRQHRSRVITLRSGTSRRPISNDGFLSAFEMRGEKVGWRVLSLSGA